MNQKYLNTYVVISIVYLTLIAMGQETITWYLKPILLLPLIFAVFTNKNAAKDYYLKAALLLSWIGDIILMFVYKSENYFIFGLVSFLLAHICYILLFRKDIVSKPKTNNPNPIFYTLIGVFWMLMMYVLYPKLGEMKIPVTVYSLVICTMLAFVYYGSSIWKKQAANFILVGATFFVLSDGILAFNKFYQPLPFASFLIMCTYLIAQFYIVKGWGLR
jgi:uncharacterized membrane protein YhhN